MPSTRHNRGCVIRRLPGVTAAPVCSLAVEDLPVPVPQTGEVLIELKVVGICGSDVHYWQHGHIGDFVVGESLVLGHEAAGVVAELGEGVTGLKVGDRVALEPGVPCGACAHCKTGRYNLCPGMRFWATPPYDGCLATFAVLSAANCFLLPDALSFEDGACLEPFSVGVHACRRAGVTVASRVLIMGSGPIGIVCLLAAKAFGAKFVTVADVEVGRVEVARQCGADHTIHVKDSGTFDILAHLPERPEIALECTGAESAVAMALEACATGGKVVNIGCGPNIIRVPLVQACLREVDILGNFRYCNTWPIAIDMVAAKKVDFGPMVTHRFSFDKPGDVERAFDCTLRCKDADGNGSIKVLICMTVDTEPSSNAPAGEVPPAPEVPRGSFAVPINEWFGTGLGGLGSPLGA
jgi:L-iditol 2-dehydrogenase